MIKSVVLIDYKCANGSAGGFLFMAAERIRPVCLMEELKKVNCCRP